MLNTNNEETKPVEVNTSANFEQNSQNQQTNPDQSQPKRWKWILVGVAAILVLGFIGGLIGYSAAIQNRKRIAADQNTLIATTQYELGVADYQAGRLDTAKRRFEYVIQADPNYPGARERLTEVMLALATLKTPTPIPSPTMTIEPTPDFTGVEEMITRAQELLANKQWEDALSVLDLARKENIGFRTVDVDGMYYIALRERGVQKIIYDGNLEGGIYDLARVEKFAPLDRDADGFRTFARFYLTGASFWKVDWPQVLVYFEQVYPFLPNLRDTSGWTAQERYRIALVQYGDQLLLAEEPCKAKEQYEKALVFGVDEKVNQSFELAKQKCEPPKPTSEPATPTPQVTPTGFITTPQTTPTGNVPTPQTTPTVVEPTAQSTPSDIVPTVQP
jgi:tetratricopeptide (TPR) repeat protein